MTTVYISIGNSDDKLSQADWSEFVRLVNESIDARLVDVHGRWLSESSTRWQNACWCIEIDHVKAASFRRELALLAHRFRQDSIAWAVAETEFIAGASHD